jgi:hypothetical protein
VLQQRARAGRGGRPGPAEGGAPWGRGTEWWRGVPQNGAPVAGAGGASTCVLPEAKTFITTPQPPPKELISTYKFAFTPENSNDEGYVTEKVYAALRAGEGRSEGRRGSAMLAGVGPMPHLRLGFSDGRTGLVWPDWAWFWAWPGWVGVETGWGDLGLESHLNLGWEPNLAGLPTSRQRKTTTGPFGRHRPHLHGCPRRPSPRARARGGCSRGRL